MEFTGSHLSTVAVAMVSGVGQLGAWTEWSCQLSAYKQWCDMQRRFSSLQLCKHVEEDVVSNVKLTGI